MRTLRILPFQLAATMCLAACGPGRIAKSTIETKAMEALTKQVGQQSPQITCPGDMPAEVGASLVCSVPLTNGTYDVTVTITAVNGSDATFSVVVASTPHA